MTPLGILGHMIVRSARLGALFAPISFVGGFLLIGLGADAVLYTIVCAITWVPIAGAALGMIVGGLSGLICATITLTFYHTLHNEIIYFQSMTVIALISSFCMGVLISGSIHTYYAVVSVPLINEVSFAGGLFAAFVVTVTARDVARKYIMSQRLTESPTAWMKTS